jgi:hypothetical protein
VAQVVVVEEICQCPPLILVILSEALLKEVLLTLAVVEVEVMVPAELQLLLLPQLLVTGTDKTVDLVL